MNIYRNVLDFYIGTATVKGTATTATLNTVPVCIASPNPYSMPGTIPFSTTCSAFSTTLMLNLPRNALHTLLPQITDSEPDLKKNKYDELLPKPFDLPLSNRFSLTHSLRESDCHIKPNPRFPLFATPPTNFVSSMVPVIISYLLVPST